MTRMTIGLSQVLKIWSIFADFLFCDLELMSSSVRTNCLYIFCHQLLIDITFYPRRCHECYLGHCVEHVSHLWSTLTDNSSLGSQAMVIPSYIAEEDGELNLSSSVCKAHAPLTYCCLWLSWHFQLPSEWWITTSNWEHIASRLMTC